MKYIMIVIVSIVLSVLVGCNTMAGLGKDIQEGGEAIERTAQ